MAAIQKQLGCVFSSYPFLSLQYCLKGIGHDIWYKSYLYGVLMQVSILFQ